jgi:phosphatidate cytidylyltransferase
MTSKQIRIVLGTILVFVVSGLFALDYFLESRIAGSSVAALLGLAGFLEFAKMNGSLSKEGAARSRALTALGLLATAYFLGLAWWQGATQTQLSTEWLAGGIAALIFFSFVAILFRTEYAAPFPSLAPTVFGALLFGLLYSYLLRIYIEHGTLVGVVFCLGVKGTDISAYLVGSSIGKHRYLKVSPGKTLEGSAAALVFGALWFGGAAWWRPEVFFEWPLGIVFGIILAVTSPLGDLAESLLKRCYGVKDSGALLPEFGGVLDMIDSFLFSSFLFWCLLAAT